jgi:hypothetical protein
MFVVFWERTLDGVVGRHVYYAKYTPMNVDHETGGKPIAYPHLSVSGVSDINFLAFYHIHGITIAYPI